MQVFTKLRGVMGWNKLGFQVKQKTVMEVFAMIFFYEIYSGVCLKKMDLNKLEPTVRAALLQYILNKKALAHNVLKHNK